MTPSPSFCRFVVLDFETTGLEPSYGARVIEVSAREVVNGEPRRRIRHRNAAIREDLGITPLFERSRRSRRTARIHGEDCNGSAPRNPFSSRKQDIC